MDDLRSHKMIMGATRVGMSVMPTATEIVAKTTAIGVLGGRFLAEPRAGVRKPFSADRKTKARKSTKLAAKSRRRNRQ